ncbi:uncharacterized protein LOC126482202 [Schistocerca serialis cubense]|uniref:uncharacterized protein LOC126482202 n=1 Tax=Schistocerca serialis cubense TaxID=2023355 RepID=UPI00214E9CBE|nr:uncharacterized protein LOC126482202 [Schistocerca serialis cubense]
MAIRHDSSFPLGKCRECHTNGGCVTIVPYLEPSFSRYQAGTSLTQVSLCVGDGAGGLATSTLETCTDGLRCSAGDEACTQPELSECRSGSANGFECRAAGYFPDPYNCSIYHLCPNVGDPNYVTGTCTGAWAYNPLTTDCSLERTERPCSEGPVPRCLRLGQAGALPENAAIHYVCARVGGRLVPQLYRCPQGLVWDEGRYE